jgi:hypothetical protein
MFSNSPSIADIAAVTDGNRNSGGWGDGNGWWVLIILFALFGWGGNRGFGGGNTGDCTFNGGVPNGFALATDFASLERKMDGVNNGLCDGFYATANGMNTGFAAVQNALCQGFSGVNQAVVSQGYESRLGTQALQAQLAQCCCDTQAAIQANTTQGVMNTNAVQQQVASCCCEQEKQAMQTRFDMAQNQCATLQAIDKVGDRIVDYMAQEKMQALRDENQALRLAASQSQQNQYLVDQLRPCPQPAYITSNPWGANGYGGYGYGGCCGTGCGCN